MEKLHCALQIRLAKDTIFFGPGVLNLLKLTHKHESLRAAAKEMSLSYTKANKMIKGTEDALGFKILDRKIGGVGGGGSSLTKEGIEFLEAYINFEKEINESSSQIFEKHFNKYI
ncbi:MAG: LysR family transcriptional regulator [Bacteroidales bacterium]|jgi:molybdate transport system regulatory protein|nr:LysR family transcriptional regulator [Tissierellia bacterium]